MSQPLPIAVVGLGRTGWRNHLQNLKSLPEFFRIAAVADRMEERRSEAKKEFGCRAYAELEELLACEDPGWIVIATPTFLHRQQTLQALAKGWNVICEKPLAPTPDEAGEMIAAAKSAGQWLTVFQQNRYAPDFQKVREVIESGILGRVFSIRSCWNNFNRRWDWQTLQKNGGGNLNNTGPHPLDQMLQLFGPEQPVVSCHQDSLITVGDADDHVKILLRGKDSPTIDLEISSVDAIGDPRWKIQGTCGGLTGSAERLTWKYYNPAELPERKVDEAAPADRGYHSETFPWKTGEWTLPQGLESAHLTYYRDLAARLQSGLAPQVTAEDALRVAEISDACRADSLEACGPFARSGKNGLPAH